MFIIIIFSLRERERGREGGRDSDVRKKHQSVASHVCPDRGWNPQPFSVWDDTPTMEPPARARVRCF